MGNATSIPARIPGPRLGSKRLLRLAGDERLVHQIRRGDEVAFEVVFERHGPAILAFCRHMLGSPEEAEDAVQHTFAAAYRQLRSDREREILLQPWLFTVARNRCLSILRARRERAVDEPELVTAGLAEEVERRAELRELLGDLRDLPEEQRAALLLAEVGDLSHAQVADVLGCKVARVKALIHRARTALIARRDARVTSCEQIREQLATVRGGSLRRNELRLHLRECVGCRAYGDQVAQQRRMLGVALPVAPTLGLKSNVLAAAGIGGGASGGAAAAGLAGTFGGSTLAKVAVVGVLAGGGTVAGSAVVDSQRDGAPVRPAAPAAAVPAGERDASAEQGPAGSGAAPATDGAERRGARSRADDPRPGRGHARGRGRGDNGPKATPPGQAKARENRRKLGHDKQPKARSNRGRGPIAAPPPDTPVRRGPPEPKPNPVRPAPKAEAKPEARALPAPPLMAPAPEEQLKKE